MYNNKDYCKQWVQTVLFDNAINGEININEIKEPTKVDLN